MAKKEEKRKSLPEDSKILVARITAAHGIKGLVKVQSFTSNPEDFIAYAPLVTAQGKEINLQISGLSKGQFLMEVEGVSDRNSAEGLKGTDLYAYRSNMGDIADDEFFVSDIIGFEVTSESGTSYGSIHKVLNYGSCDLFEIKTPKGQTFLVPYTTEHVKDIVFEDRKMVVGNIGQLLDLGGIKL